MAAPTSDPLSELLDAWDKSSGSGRDEDRARALAKSYVDAHSDDFTEFAGKSVEDLVGMVDGCRKAHDVWEETGAAGEVLRADVRRLLIDVYLLATVPKREIGAVINPVPVEEVVSNG